LAIGPGVSRAAAVNSFQAQFLCLQRGRWYWDSGEVFYHEVLSDPDAAIWVNGQTHVVTDVEITGPDQYLTILTAKDRERSPKPGGGNSVISAIQIIELREHDNSNQEKGGK